MHQVAHEVALVLGVSRDGCEGTRPDGPATHREQHLQGRVTLFKGIGPRVHAYREGRRGKYFMTFLYRIKHLQVASPHVLNLFTIKFLSAHGVRTCNMVLPRRRPYLVHSGWCRRLVNPIAAGSWPVIL